MVPELSITRKISTGSFFEVATVSSRDLVGIGVAVGGGVGVFVGVAVAVAVGVGLGVAVEGSDALGSDLESLLNSVS